MMHTLPCQVEAANLCSCRELNRGVPFWCIFPFFPFPCVCCCCCRAKRSLRRMLAVLTSVSLLQRFTRGWMARRRCRLLREAKRKAEKQAQREERRRMRG